MHGIRKNIVWLASYPKSGNTWFRIFLSNLLSNSKEPASINHLHLLPIVSSRSIFDRYLGTHTSDLTYDEIDSLRPRVYRLISKESKNDIFLKTHDAWGLNADGNPIFPEEVTKGAVYLIRNPLDIAVSFAFHNNADIDKTISEMNNTKYGLCLNNSKLMNQIPQHLLSWSEHVISWVHRSNLPVYVLRYEDMIGEPEKTFSRVLGFLQIAYTDKKLSLALQNSAFDKLSEQEEKNGFRERPIHSKKFFRSGQINYWKIYLSTTQVKQIIKLHRTVMEEFGYLE